MLSADQSTHTHILSAFPCKHSVRTVIRAGAICVMMLSVIRFPNPWAFNQAPPKVYPRIKPRYNVHICVPCYNEPSDIVFATCEAALSLRHEWATVTVHTAGSFRPLGVYMHMYNM